MFRYMMQYSSFSSWITHFLACMGVWRKFIEEKTTYLLRDDFPIFLGLQFDCLKLVSKLRLFNRIFNTLNKTNTSKNYCLENIWFCKKTEGANNEGLIVKQ